MQYTVPPNNNNNPIVAYMISMYKSIQEFEFYNHISLNIFSICKFQLLYLITGDRISITAKNEKENHTIPR